MGIQLHKTIAISENGMVFNPSTGESFTTNETGLKIIKLLNSGNTQQEVMHALSTEYQMDSSGLERDLADFLDVLRHFQLLNENE